MHSVQFKFLVKTSVGELLLFDASDLAEAPWMLYALQEKQKGVKAVSGSQSNPDIVKYLQTLVMAELYNPSTDWNSDETNWCAAFVNWCLGQAGHQGTNMGLARSYLHWSGGSRLMRPRFGCITVFKRGNAPLGHIGFFLAFKDSQRTKILLLGGNQSRRVKVSTYNEADKLGYVWPSRLP